MLTAIVPQEVDITTILQFRKALAFISDEYPFSPSFGSARTRELCIKSSQEVFERLTSKSSYGILEFDTLGLICRSKDGGFDKVKAKELMRVFRPNRAGHLTKIEFVKSVDR